jgi:hypothetical protein
MSEEIFSEQIDESPVNEELLKPISDLQSIEKPPKAKFSLKKIIILSLLTISLVLSSIALFNSKPNEDNFELWVKKEAAEKRKKTGNLVKKGVSIATQIQILATYSYTDRFLFVTVKASANGEKLHFIGLANKWILLP